MQIGDMLMRDNQVYVVRSFDRSRRRVWLFDVANNVSFNILKTLVKGCYTPLL